MQQYSAQHWRKVQDILDKAFDLPTDQRIAYLDQTCEGDTRLYRDVATLLRAEADSPRYLDLPALNLFQFLVSSACGNRDLANPDYTDLLIGPYRLCNELGRGGMGVVYRAQRADGNFDQQVAIKLLWNCQDRKMRLDRFQREQQLLASLNHPHIAQLYDGGLTEDGQPYIVMEYVQGEPIHEYCVSHSLSIEDRLELTLQVIDALQFAHRNLIIHRDIKPSNILVTDRGKIKLLDFGIAKMLEDQVTPQGPAAVDLTQTNERILTPGYAAPEQLYGQNVSVATDVFQLGLVLYELLTGRQAFREHAGSFYELARNICERSPTKPSAIARQGIGQARNKLAGDLDAIVLKALRSEPDKRYASMEALGADIQSYFAARPVAAREKNTRYRAGKFLRRNALAVLAAFAVGVLTIAYAATVTIQAKRIQESLDRSRWEARKAHQVSDFLVDVFKVSDPNVSETKTVTARDLLDRGREKVREQLKDAPEIRAEMLHVIGQIYDNLGSYKESVALLESALEIRRRIEASDIALAKTLAQLAFVYNATDQYSKAQTHLEEALTIHRLTGVESVAQAEILNALGEAQRMQASHEQAEASFRKASAMLRRVTKGDQKELAMSLHGLAMLQLLQGDAVQAEANSREAVRQFRNTLGANHSYYTVALNGLGLILVYLERYQDAEPLHRRALKIQRRMLGSEHPYVAQTLRYLGYSSRRQGNLAVATDYYRQALLIHKNVDGDESVAVARVLRQLGIVLTEQGQYAEAESVFAAMLKIDTAAFEAQSPTIGRDLSARASLALAKGELQRARDDYELALEMLPPGGTRTAAAQEGYARVLLRLGEVERAKHFAGAALDAREAELPPRHSLVAEARSTLGAVLARSGRGDEAKTLLTQAYDVLQLHREDDDLFLKQIRSALKLIGSNRYPRKSI